MHLVLNCITAFTHLSSDNPLSFTHKVKCLQLLFQILREYKNSGTFINQAVFSKHALKVSSQSRYHQGDFPEAKSKDRIPEKATYLWEISPHVPSETVGKCDVEKEEPSKGSV